MPHSRAFRVKQGLILDTFLLPLIHTDNPVDGTFSQKGHKHFTAKGEFPPRVLQVRGMLPAGIQRQEQGRAPYKRFEFPEQAL
jgi:hypothetical protein